MSRDEDNMSRDESSEELRFSFMTDVCMIVEGLGQFHLCSSTNGQSASLFSVCVHGIHIVPKLGARFIFHEIHKNASATFQVIAYL